MSYCLVLPCLEHQVSHVNVSLVKSNVLRSDQTYLDLVGHNIVHIHKLVLFDQEYWILSAQNTSFRSSLPINNFGTYMMKYNGANAVLYGNAVVVRPNFGGLSYRDLILFQHHLDCIVHIKDQEEEDEPTWEL